MNTKYLITLGVRTNLIKKKELLKWSSAVLDGDRARYIVTPNPEIILSVEEDEELFYILNSADMSLADGVGIFFSGLTFAKFSPRITGADFSLELLKIAEDKKKKCLLVLWSGGLTREKDLESKIRKLFPELEFLIVEVKKDASDFPFETVNRFAPGLMLVALGSPWQEKFIYHNKDKIKNLKLAMVVGGALDFISAKAKRAPKFLRIIGLEWFWRLLTQVNRWKRIYQATIIFPIEIIKWRFIKRFFYRPNVACLVYKIEEDKKLILVAKRRGEKNHWQLPQGGTDGLDLKTAGLKELSEELNCTDFRFKAVYKNLYKYKFGDTINKYNVFSRVGSGYRGQKQGLLIVEFIGNDQDIKVNFWEHEGWKWVEADKLVEVVFERRKKSAKIYLNKFNSLIG